MCAAVGLYIHFFPEIMVIIKMFIVSIYLTVIAHHHHHDHLALKMIARIDINFYFLHLQNIVCSPLMFVV
jgi:hypothetical protein